MPEEAAASQGMAPVHGYRPGEKKTQMLPQGRREYALQCSLMKVTGSDLMKLLRMITTLSIIHNPTFWVAHDAYLSSRFKLLQVLEKYTLLGAIVRQYERSKPGVTVHVQAYRDRRAKLRFAIS